MNSDQPSTLQLFLYALVLVISLFIIITYILSMGLGILVLFSTAEGLKFVQGPLQIYPLLIIDVPLEVNAGLYFVFLWWVFALCFAAAWKYRQSLQSRIRDFFSTAKQNPLNNNLLAMPIITSMLLVAVIALDFLQSRGGFPAGSLPPGDPFTDFLKISRAPVVEEIIFRILPLGAFLLPYIFLVGKRTKPDFSLGKRLKVCVLSVLQPEKAKEAVGLRTIGKYGMFGGVIGAEWIMIGVTALLFGVAHYLGGWGVGKISQAALSGAVFALAYLYYGVQAPILLHWYFNYYFSVFELSSRYQSAPIDFLSLVWSTNLITGFLMWFVAIIIGLMMILKVFRREPKTIPVPEPPF